MDDETAIPGLVFSLSVVSPIGLNGSDRQDPPSKTMHKLSQLPATVVGGMARSAIDKAREVETTLGEAGNRTVETSKERTPQARDVDGMDMIDEFFTACYDSIGAIEELYL